MKTPLSSVALALVLLPGCASVTTGSYQKIDISTYCGNITYPTYCSASNTNGKWEFKTPATISIRRASSPLAIVCESSISGNYGTALPPFPATAIVGNILLGGIVGASYDIHSESGLQYKSDVKIQVPWCQKG